MKYSVVVKEVCLYILWWNIQICIFIFPLLFFLLGRVVEFQMYEKEYIVSYVFLYNNIFNNKSVFLYYYCNKNASSVAYSTQKSVSCPAKQYSHDFPFFRLFLYSLPLTWLHPGQKGKWVWIPRFNDSGHTKLLRNSHWGVSLNEMARQRGKMSP